MPTPGEILNLFPFFDETGLGSFIGSVTKIPAGACAFMEGDYSIHVAFIAKGALRVVKTGESGREIVLYKVLPGESCILQLSSVLSGVGYPATAIVEHDVEAIMVPVERFKQSINESQFLRNFVYGSFTKRIAWMMSLIEEVAFKRMDVRLIELLLSRTSPEQPELNMTHERIALELGTAREVISRLLKNLEHDALVELARGKVTIINRNGLDAILPDR